MKRAVILFFLLVLIAGCSNNADNHSKNSQSTTLTVSAAVSLTDALDELKTQYEKDHDIALKFNLGGSGTLAQQIQQGAPADIFISANEDWMNTLEQNGDIDAETRHDIASNRIVMIARKNSNLKLRSIQDLDPSKVDQIAIGNPESVPVGKYTKQTLENMHLWNKLSQDQLVQAKDVRQVLSYVETGNTEIGFVYESDAKISDKVKVLAVADTHAHDPIVYPAAVTSASKHKEAAKEFLSFLQSDQAQKTLQKYGFKQTAND